MKPNSPIDAWRTLAIGINNGEFSFVFDFDTEDQADSFKKMLDNIVKWKLKVSKKVTVVKVYKR